MFDSLAITTLSIIFILTGISTVEELKAWFKLRKKGKKNERKPTPFDWYFHTPHSYSYKTSSNKTREKTE